METSTIRAALFTTDESLRSLVKSMTHPAGRGVTLALEVGVPFTHLGDAQLRELRAAEPELAILDIEPDPVLGIKFAQFLSEQSPQRRILAVGPTPSSDQLLTALRAGVSEYLPKPVTREALAPAIDSLARKLRWSPTGSPAQPGQLFAVFGGKGGSGATTVATNMAIYLHRLTGRRTLLVDLDLELGEIALLLGAEPRFNFIDIVRNFHRMDADLLASYIEHHGSGVHLLSAPYHPQKTEVVTGEQISRILHFLKQHYDFVVVDTSKSFSPPTLATFEQADQIHLVTTVDVASLRNIARCLPLLRQIAAPAEERIRLVLNRYHDDGLIRISDVEKTLGLKVFRTVANDYDAVVRSVNTGTPLVLDGDSRCARDLRALGAEVAGLEVGAETAGPTLARTLTRLWRRTFVREPEAQA